MTLSKDTTRTEAGLQSVSQDLLLLVLLRTIPAHIPDFRLTVGENSTWLQARLASLFAWHGTVQKGSSGRERKAARLTRGAHYRPWLERHSVAPSFT